MRNGWKYGALFSLYSTLSLNAQADTLSVGGAPASMQVVGYEHIQWQQIHYSQGGCSVPLTGIAYWSPTHAMQSENDQFYTPVVNIHGGGWRGKIDYAPPVQNSDPNDVAAENTAAEVQRWVEKGLLIVYPTYRGAAEALDPLAFPACDHPRELIKDAEFLVRAIVEENPAVPIFAEIRDGEAVKLQGASAGAHVGMSLAVRNPDWYDRFLGLLGVYDMHLLRTDWDGIWDDYIDSNLDECEAQYDGKVTAKTKGTPTTLGESFRVTQKNCGRIAQLDQVGEYKITDAANPGTWAVVDHAIFTEVEEQIGGQTVTSLYFLDGSFIYPEHIPIVSSSEGGDMPAFTGAVIIQEVTLGSAPTITQVEMRAAWPENFKETHENLFNGFLNVPDGQTFRDILANDPIFTENSFGKIVKNGTGEYPAFRLMTNSGDFTLPEQALAVCNDIQLSDGFTQINQPLTQDAKGTIYQCGEKGSLSISNGGNHFYPITENTYYVRATVELEAHFNWLVSSSETTHSLKSESCGEASSPETNWLTSGLDPNFFVSASFWGLQLGTFEIGSSYGNEWEAIINDPLYVGSDVTHFPLFAGEGFIARAGDKTGDSWVDTYKLCLKAL